LLIFGPFSFQSVTEFFIGDDGRKFFLRLMNTKDFELIEAFIERLTVGSSCTLLKKQHNAKKKSLFKV